jgi:hypothetical protein
MSNAGAFICGMIGLAVFSFLMLLASESGRRDQTRIIAASCDFAGKFTAVDGTVYSCQKVQP